MLDLQSPKWRNLTHAYGSAEDIPALIEQLRTAPVPKSYQDDPWFSLWSALCHQSDVYTGSYAAVPHVVGIAAEKPEKERIPHISFIACIEACRHRKKAPRIPTDLRSSYLLALEQVANLILECLMKQWDEKEYAILLGAFAVMRGQPRLGNAITELPEESTCPECDAAVPPLGYDLNDYA
jgi:hypothetical protein